MTTQARIHCGSTDDPAGAQPIEAVCARLVDRCRGEAARIRKRTPVEKLDAALAALGQEYAAKLHKSLSDISDQLNRQRDRLIAQFQAGKKLPRKPEIILRQTVREVGIWLWFSMQDDHEQAVQDLIAVGEDIEVMQCLLDAPHALGRDRVTPKTWAEMAAEIMRRDRPDLVEKLADLAAEEKRIESGRKAALRELALACGVKESDLKIAS